MFSSPGIAQLQATVLEQQRVIERLERRIAELEGQAKPDGPPRMPGLKSSSGRQPPAQQQPRKQRRHGFARPRMTTDPSGGARGGEVCPDCGTHLTGGWVQRTREVIELPVVPVQVTEHVFIARTCPVCRRRRVPTAQLDGAALGLPAVGRQPDQSHRQHATGRRAPADPQHPVVSAHRPSAEPQRGGHRERHSPDRATGLNQRWLGWWTASAPAQWSTPTKPAGVQNGNNGYVWTFSTPTERYFLRRGRGKAAWWTKRWASRSPECWSAISTLPTAIDDGPKQRCWAHLLRDIH